MRNVMGVLWRSLVVGAAYLIALMIGGMLVRLAGLSLPEVGDVPARLLWSFVGGTIVGLCLGPIAASMPVSRARHWLVWASVILFNLASVTIEGRFFAPQLVAGALPGLLIQQLLTALAAGWIISVLFAPQQAAAPTPAARRPWFSWTWRFLVSAASYVVFYFVFGAINYALVTKPYYATHAGGLAVPAPQTVLAAELVRGPLIVLSVLPFLLSARVSRARRAVLTGLILFAIGGLVPLSMQVNSLPAFLLAASAVEIFFQNFSTGLVTAYLFSDK